MQQFQILKNKFLIILITLLFIFLTNSYFNYNDSLIYGAADILHYYRIALIAPELPDGIIGYHYSQRFLAPYLVGLISKLSSLDIIYIARFFVIAVLFAQIFYVLKINILIKVNEKNNILSILIILLNPYNFRYYLSNPLMIQDFAFQLCFIILIYYFLKADKIKLIFITFISFFLRQTSISFLVGLLIISIYDKKFFKIKELLLLILLFVFSFFIITLISEKISINNAFPFEHITGLYRWFIKEYDSVKLMLFFLLPLISYSPLIIFKILSKKEDASFKDTFLLFLGITIIIIFLQPILAGPHITGKNIIRLTSLAFPVFVIYFNYKTVQSSLPFKYKNFIYRYFPILLVIWSLHPKYSNIGFYFFKNYNFFSNIF